MHTSSIILSVIMLARIIVGIYTRYWKIPDWFLILAFVSIVSTDFTSNNPLLTVILVSATIASLGCVIYTWEGLRTSKEND